MQSPTRFGYAISLVEQELTRDINIRICDANVLPPVLGNIVAGYATVADLDQRLLKDTHEFHRIISDCVRLSLRVSNEYNYHAMACARCGLGSPHIDFVITAYLSEKMISSYVSSISMSSMLRSIAESSPIKHEILYQKSHQKPRKTPRKNPHQKPRQESNRPTLFMHMCECLGIPNIHIQMAIDSMMVQFLNSLR